MGIKLEFVTKFQTKFDLIIFFQIFSTGHEDYFSFHIYVWKSGRTRLRLVSLKGPFSLQKLIIL